MKVFFWIFKKLIATPVSILGLLYYLACSLQDGSIDFEMWVLYVGAGLALIGLVIGSFHDLSHCVFHSSQFCHIGHL